MSEALTERWSIFFRGCDLDARLLLNRIGMGIALDNGSRSGAALLLVAELYLADRRAYEVDRVGVMLGFRRQVALANAIKFPVSTNTVRAGERRVRGQIG